MAASNSLNIAGMQRDREAKSLVFFLSIAIPCSIVFHFVSLLALGTIEGWHNSAAKKEEIIEIIAVEPPEEKIEQKQEEPQIIEENIPEPKVEEPIEAVQESNPAPAPKSVVPSSQTVKQPLGGLQESAPNKILEGTDASQKIPVSASNGNGSAVDTDAIARIRSLLQGRSGSPNGIGNPLDSPTGTGTSPTPSTGSPSGTLTGKGKLSCQICGKPDYPAGAKERGLEGQAKVAVDVDANGNVTNVRILNSSGHAELDQAAIEAARKWKFTPTDAGKSGVPAKVDFQIENSQYSKVQAEQRRQQERQAEIERARQTPPPPSTAETARKTSTPIPIPAKVENVPPQPQPVELAPIPVAKPSIEPPPLPPAPPEPVNIAPPPPPEQVAPPPIAEPAPPAPISP